MSDPLSSQSSSRPNNGQRYDDDDDDNDVKSDDDDVIKSDVTHWRLCRGDCRWRCGFNPRDWDHCFRKAATETSPFPRIRRVILFGRRCGGEPPNDGDAVQPNTRRGGTAGSRISDGLATTAVWACWDSGRRTVFCV